MFIYTARGTIDGSYKKMEVELMCSRDMPAVSRGVSESGD